MLTLALPIRCGRGSEAQDEVCWLKMSVRLPQTIDKHVDQLAGGALQKVPVLCELCETQCPYNRSSISLLLVAMTLANRPLARVTILQLQHNSPTHSLPCWQVSGLWGGATGMWRTAAQSLSETVTTLSARCNRHRCSPYVYWQQLFTRRISSLTSCSKASLSPAPIDDVLPVIGPAGGGGRARCLLIARRQGRLGVSRMAAQLKASTPCCVGPRYCLCC